MRHLTIRLQLAWLTVAALAAFGLVGALRPEGGVADAELSAETAQFRESLRPDSSIETLNLFRAQLAADLVFLVAYWLLLRQSLLYIDHRRAGVARHGAIVTMIADAAGNVCALAVLRTLAEGQAEAPRWLFATMNAAALTRWAAAGLVLLVLAAGWRRCAPTLRPPLRLVGFGIAFLFAAGALGSFLTALSPLHPPVRSVSMPAALLGPAIALLLQLRLLALVGPVLRFLYLARVPLLVLLAVTAFGPVALGPFVRLFGGIIDIATPWGMGVVTAAALVLAFACATQINLVRAYAWQRMFDPSLRVLRHRVLTRAVSWTTVIASGSFLFCVAVASPRVPLLQVVFAMAAGVVVGCVFLVVVELAAAWMSIAPADRPLPQLALPFARFPVIGHWLREARAASAPLWVTEIRAFMGRWSIAGRLFGLSSGYIRVDTHGRRRLLAGHVFATIQLALSGVFYVALLAGKLPGDAPAAEAGLWIPTAGSILLLLLLCSWAFAGIAFFLDRYRTPLFSAMLSVMLITGTLADTDYVVATSSDEGPYRLATPGQVLGAFPRPIVVAAAGGGIQAGAWTARVLEGIQD